MHLLFATIAESKPFIPRLSNHYCLLVYGKVFPRTNTTRPAECSKTSPVLSQFQKDLSVILSFKPSFQLLCCSCSVCLLLVIFQANLNLIILDTWRTALENHTISSTKHYLYFIKHFTMDACVIESPLSATVGSRDTIQESGCTLVWYLWPNAYFHPFFLPYPVLSFFAVLVVVMESLDSARCRLERDLFPQNIYRLLYFNCYMYPTLQSLVKKPMLTFYIGLFTSWTVSGTPFVSLLGPLLLERTWRGLYIVNIRSD